MYYRITTHAAQRFRERGGTCDKLDDEDLRALLRAELERGIPFGSRFGRAWLLLLPRGVVAVLKASDNQVSVLTILTWAQALANMQPRRSTVWRHPIPAIVRFALRGLPAEQENKLRLLAEAHFELGTGRAERYRDLRARGFETGRLALKRYDEIYEEVRAEFYVQGRDHSRSHADAA